MPAQTGLHFPEDTKLLTTKSYHKRTRKESHMRHINLDRQSESVREFFRTLRLGIGGVALKLDGKVICKVVSPNQMTPAEAKAFIAQRWELIRRARERNKGVPAKVIAKEVEAAVDEVRKRKRPKPGRR